MAVDDVLDAAGLAEREEPERLLPLVEHVRGRVAQAEPAGQPLQGRSSARPAPRPVRREDKRGTDHQKPHRDPHAQGIGGRSASLKWWHALAAVVLESGDQTRPATIRARSSRSAVETSWNATNRSTTVSPLMKPTVCDLTSTNASSPTPLSGFEPGFVMSGA
jgi:hypothetical protein